MTIHPESPLPSQADPLNNPQGMLARALLGETTDSLIMTQEAQGAAELRTMDMLPRLGTLSLMFHGDYPGYTNDMLRTAWEQLGFEFGDDIDDLFVAVRFPSGWTKRAGENANYWTDIIDERGRVRAAMFYKAAFYDRSAYISAMSRYVARYVPTQSLDLPADWHAAYEWQKNPVGDPPLKWHAVFDRALPSPVSEGTPIFVAGSCVDPMAFGDEGMHQHLPENDRLEVLTREWLVEHYPNYKDPFAYWG